MRKAVIIKSNGTSEVVEMPSADKELKFLQDAVGGYVQVVTLREGLNIWVNEEGKLNRLPYNNTATIIWSAFFGDNTDIMVGDVIFTGGFGDDEEGTTEGLTDELIAELTNVCESISFLESVI